MDADESDRAEDTHLAEILESLGVEGPPADWDEAIDRMAVAINRFSAYDAESALSFVLGTSEP